MFSPCFGHTPCLYLCFACHYQLLTPGPHQRISSSTPLQIHLVSLQSSPDRTSRHRGTYSYLAPVYTLSSSSWPTNLLNLNILSRASPYSFSLFIVRGPTPPACLLHFLQPMRPTLQRACLLPHSWLHPINLLYLSSLRSCTVLCVYCSWVQQLSLPIPNRTIWPPMDPPPADMDSFRQALSTQGALVEEHSQALREAMEAFLSTRVTQMGAQLDLLVSHATASPPATVPPPAPYSPGSAATGLRTFRSCSGALCWGHGYV